VEEGWPVRRAAERFQVSPTTAARWAGRYRQHGAAGMADRSSRPRTSPNRTPRRTERRIVGPRGARRAGPARVRTPAGPPGAPRPRLAYLDRGSGRGVRRYERARPGELVHVDVKKLGKIPDGGGWRTVGIVQGMKNRRATTGLRQGKTSHPVIGYSY